MPIDNLFQSGTGIATIKAVNANVANNISGAFPEDLGSGTFNFWMSLSFYTYQRPTQGELQGSYTNGYLGDLGTIRLPLPNSMIDHQDQAYDLESIGLITSLMGSVGNLANKVLGSQGQTANPFMAVFYKSPAFKTHNFMWRLTPTNGPESTKLNSIISTIKANQLPTINGLMLGYPSIVQVTISNASVDNFSYAFKPAVIKSFEVNYTPEGQPSFFTGTNAPTAVEMRMELLEIEYWSQSDYNGLNAPNAG